MAIKFQRPWVKDVTQKFTPKNRSTRIRKSTSLWQATEPFRLSRHDTAGHRIPSPADDPRGENSPYTSRASGK